MNVFRHVFGPRSLEEYVRRIRARLAACELVPAQRTLEEALAQFPGAEVLREVELQIRRDQAREGIRSLRSRIEDEADPRAYDQLISLYLELGMSLEARREALGYANAHPDRDTPHLLLGEMGLQDFLEDLQARDGYMAEQRLRRAAGLNELAIKPRLLLAELYHCIGADLALKGVAAEIRALDVDDPHLDEVLRQIDALVAPEGSQTVDGLLERVEVEGALKREPRTWPLTHRTTGITRVPTEAAEALAKAVVARGDAAELVLLHRNGKILAHAKEGDAEGTTPDSDNGLLRVTRGVAQTVARYARDLDLGAFKRCTMRGPFGLIAVGEIAGLVAGLRASQRFEAQRIWDRIQVDLEGALGGGQL